MAIIIEQEAYGATVNGVPLSVACSVPADAKGIIIATSERHIEPAFGGITATLLAVTQVDRSGLNLWHVLDISGRANDNFTIDPIYYAGTYYLAWLRADSDLVYRDAGDAGPSGDDAIVSLDPDGSPGCVAFAFGAAGRTGGAAAADLQPYGSQTQLLEYVIGGGSHGDVLNYSWLDLGVSGDPADVGATYTYETGSVVVVCGLWGELVADSGSTLSRTGEASGFRGLTIAPSGPSMTYPARYGERSGFRGLTIRASGPRNVALLGRGLGTSEMTDVPAVPESGPDVPVLRYGRASKPRYEQLADLAAEAGIGGGSDDHGGLTGLSDDDHPQYATNAEFDDHNARHESGGADAIKLDDLAAPDDNTDLNASTSKHGLLQKLPGGTTTFLRADGTFAAAGASLTVEEDDASPSVSSVDKLVFPAGTVTDLGSGDVSVREVPTGVIGAKAYHNTTQGSLAAVTVNALDMNSEDWDTDGFHSTSVNTSRFTVPAGLGGKYLLIGRAAVNAVNFTLYWRVNGATLLGGGPESDVASLNEVVQVAELAAGNYVQLCEYHSTGTGTAGHASTRHVQTEGIVVKLGSGNVSGLDTARAKRTSGNLTLNSTTWADVDTGMDLVVPAQAGDVLLVPLSALAGSEAEWLWLDAASIVSGSPVNYISGGHTQGIAGWMCPPSVLSFRGATVQYVVQAGDISGGNVLLRLRYKNTGSNKTLYASTTDGALQWSVVNLRGGAASRDIGYEFAYAEFTSDVSVASTTEASPTNVVSAPAVVFDGNTTVIVEFYSVELAGGTAGQVGVLNLWDGSTDLGRMALFTVDLATDWRAPVLLRRRLTPSAGSHTYHWKAWRNSGTGSMSVDAGAGGAGTRMPGYIRVTKA